MDTYLHYYLILSFSFLGLDNAYTPSAELNISAFDILSFHQGSLLLL